jgi:hypothetical protein
VRGEHLLPGPLILCFVSTLIFCPVGTVMAVPCWSDWRFGWTNLRRLAQPPWNFGICAEAKLKT